KDHAMHEGIRLGNRRYFPASFARALEGCPHDSFAAVSREDGRLDCQLVRRSLVVPAADGGILALGVLAIDEHVDGAWPLVTQRRRYALKEVGRPEIDVLVKLPPHRQEQLVDGNVVRHVRTANGAEQDGVVLGKDSPAVGGQEPTGLAVE